MDPLQFRITSAQVAPGTYVLTLRGELDLSNAGRIDRELESLESGEAQRVIVDLLDVPFIESTVIGVLLAHARRLRAHGGEVTVVTDDARVLRVFEITGLTTYFRFERALADAVEAAIAEVVR